MLASTNNFFRRDSGITAPVDRFPKPWCPQEVRARFRYVQVDGGFILDDEWPVSCRSKLVVTIEISRVSRLNL